MGEAQGVLSLSPWGGEAILTLLVGAGAGLTLALERMRSPEEAEEIQSLKEAGGIQSLKEAGGIRNPKEVGEIQRDFQLGKEEASLILKGDQAQWGWE